jgi:protein-L-isoaspartate O-methyltransferase
VVVELGCGRGRTCFWLNQFIGCRVIGIEYVPTFIEKARHVQEKQGISGVTFRLEDLFHTDLQGATTVYLYASCFSPEEIDRLIEQFSRLPDGTKIITVSYALTDYQPSAPFQLIKQFPARFTWGTAVVFLQIKEVA